MRIEWQIGFWLGTLALFVALLYVLSGVMLPFVAALVLGYLLDPLADWLEAKGLNRLSATLLILFVFISVFVLVLVFLLPVLGHQFAVFIAALPEYITKLQGLVAEQGGKLAEKFGGDGVLAKLGLGDSIKPDDMKKHVGDIVSQGGQWVGAFLKSLWTQGTALLSLVSLLVVTPVVAFYILLDWDKMVTTLDDLVPPRHRETVRDLARQIDSALAGFMRGQSLVCLFLGLWYGIGFALIGLNFGFLIGITSGVLSFIPYVGSLTAFVLSVIIAIAQGWPSWTLLLMALAVVGTGQFLEGNILSPKLVGKSVGLHPAWLMFALLAFGSLFGFTGLIVAVPVAAAAGVLLRFALVRYRHSPIYTGHHLPPSKGEGTATP